MANEYLPVGLSLKVRSCLIVGGGKVALRKIETLLDYDSQITVVAPEPDEKITYYAEKGKLQLKQRVYRSPEAQQYGLVISASDDAAVNKAVHRDCLDAGIPVNVVDNPAMCDVVFPAVLKRDCLTVAVATDGKAPFLSGHLRLILENVFPKRWSMLAKQAAQFRTKLYRHFKDQPEKRAAAIERFLGADWQTLLKDKNNDEIEQEVDRILKA